RFSKWTQFAMTVYFDEAGGRDRGFMAVCGWIATVERWGRFEVDWRLLLAHYHLPYFHMKEFVAFTRCFKRFKNNKIETKHFLEDATDIIHANVQHGFLFLMSYQTFDEV